MVVAERIDWGNLEYSEALERQRERVAKRQEDACGDAIIVVEHPHVITLGRRKEAQANVVAAAGVPVVEIERGGDVTYHGPGQIVVYPICKLGPEEQDLHKYLRNLEQGIINCLAHYGLHAGREEGKTGVWIDGRKLASMGIACRKWVTYHGLALNVTTDLSYFHRINPCGFAASVMTSVAKELDVPAEDASVAIDEFKLRLCNEVASCIGRQFSA